MYEDDAMIKVVFKSRRYEDGYKEHCLRLESMKMVVKSTV